MAEVFVFNGKEIEPDFAADRGLAYGDGLFETMRVSSAKIPLIKLHLDRLESSCKRLNIPCDRAALSDQITSLMARLPASDVVSGVVKLIYTRGCGGFGYTPPLLEDVKPATLIKYSSSVIGEPVAVDLSVLSQRLSRNASLAGMKHLSRLEYVLAAHELHRKPNFAGHGLLLDDLGYAIETLHHNLFLSVKGQLLTPSLELSGVEGVMRRLIMNDVALDCDIPVVVTHLNLEDVMQADEVFLSNSVRGIIPVKRLGRKQWRRFSMCKLISKKVAEIVNA